jgi:beta-1,4-N-acetylglucosaminyltransferase
LYIVADTDLMSEAKAHRFEREVGGVQGHNYFVKRIPRSREVGQSWTTTPFSVLRALAASTSLVLAELPDLILCNGPGICIPVCVLAYIPKILGLKHVRLVYVESFARVNSLSLSGRLLYRFVDRFLVQWRELTDRYPRAEYHGVLV